MKMQEGVKFRLSAHVSYSVAGGKLHVLGGGMLRVDDCPSDVERVMKALERGADSVELARTSEAPEFYEELFSLMCRAKLLTVSGGPGWGDVMTTPQTAYFEGLTDNSSGAAERLAQANVAILGVGGVGSVVLQHLVGAGVQRFCLIDGDVVSEFNMNRQFVYKASDIGRPKVEAAADYVRERVPRAAVACRLQFISSASQLQACLPAKVSLLVNCADFPSCEIDDVVADVSKAARVPVVFGGCRFEGGMWSSVVPPNRAVEFHGALRKKREAAGSLANVHGQASRASFGPVNTVVSAFMASEAIRYLAGIQPRYVGKMIHLDFAVPVFSADAVWSGPHVQ